MELFGKKMKNETKKSIASKGDTKTKKTSSKNIKKTNGKVSPFAHVLLGPIVTEKAYTLNDLHKYVFRVRPDATKRHVARAVKDIFGVTVEKVHMVVKAPQQKIFRGRKGQTKRQKKAIVTIVKGDKIDLFG